MAIFESKDSIAASNTLAGVTKVSSNSTMQTGTATDEAARVVDVANNFIGQGYHLIGYWPARALLKPTTNPAGTLAQQESSSNKLNDEYLPFVDAATKYASLFFRAPESFDEASTIDVEIEWCEASGASAHVVKWQAEAQAQGDGDTIDSPWGTAVTATDTGSSGTRRFIKLTGITPAGSWAAGDKVQIRIARLGGDGSDTLDVDARLIGVSVFARINAKADA